jgi:multiple sugar transport system substrate-binding protein
MIVNAVNEFVKKNSKKLILFSALLFFIALLFFPGIRSTNKIVSESIETPGIVFTQWWEKDMEKEILSEIISEFESLHGDFKIILNTCAYEDLRMALFNGETPGDVIALDPLWVSELSKKRIVENINANPVSFINILYYNIDILKEAGFSRPPKTRSEFLAYARRFTGSNGLAMGINSSRGIYDDILPWIWAGGVQLMKDGNPQVNSRQVIDCLSFLASLYSEGLLTPQSLTADSAGVSPAGFPGNKRSKLEDFISGKAAFVIAPSSEIEFVWEQMGDEAFGVTSIPIPDNYAGKSFFAVSAWTAGVYSASAQKENAKLFADFLAEKTSFLSDEMKAIHGNPPAYDAFYSKVWEIAIAGETEQDFSGFNWTELEESSKEELSALFAGKASAAETAAAIQKRWEAILGNR